jgi:Mg-chelatase subunit ChlD
VTATDESLRAAARRLASRVVLDRVRRGAVRERGTGRPRQVPADRGGDLDLDASADALLGARGEGRSPGLDELVAREWGRPALALCLVVDRSGSMTGDRLAVAALTAAACALRAPAEHAVVAFGKQVEVLRPLGAAAPPGAVVDAVLQLRGHGTTALAGALRTAADQLAGARAARRVVLLLSDCRATDGQDPVPAARAVQELIVLAPDEDSEEAAALVAAAGGRWAPLASASAVPGLLADLLA